MTTTAVVAFDRLGRNHEPPSVAVQSTDPDVIAEAVYAHARHYLASREVEVLVRMDEGAETGEVTVYAGFHVGGTGKVTIIR